LAYCQQSAERTGVAPKLYRQARHALALPRRYQTIVACGAVGLGVSRTQDFVIIQRCYDHLLPGGLLIFDGIPAYTDPELWPLWRKDARTHFPEPWPQAIGKLPADGRDPPSPIGSWRLTPWRNRPPVRCGCFCSRTANWPPMIPTRSYRTIASAMK